MVIITGVDGGEEEPNAGGEVDCASAPMERWMKDLRPGIVYVFCSTLGRGREEVKGRGRWDEEELRNIGCAPSIEEPERRGEMVNQRRRSLRDELDVGRLRVEREDKMGRSDLEEVEGEPIVRIESRAEMLISHATAETLVRLPN